MEKVMDTKGSKPIILANMRSRATADDFDRPHTPSKRTFQRVLRKMVRDGLLITTGRGVRGDPFRYFVNPAHKCCDLEEVNDLMDAPTIDPLRMKH
jgi:hypothetical protein